MRYKYYYSVHSSPQLIEFLNANQIRYKITGGGIIPVFATFSLWSSSAKTQELVERLATICHRDPIIMIEFSKRELDQANFLVVRPKKQIVEIINGEEAFAYSCARVDPFGNTRVKHEWQIGTLAIAKEPSAKTSTALWASDTGFAEIYADSRVSQLVNANLLIGIKFEKVLLKDRSYSDKLYQMTSQYLIPREMIVMGYGEKLQKCPICGKEQFSISTAYQLHLKNLNTLPYSDLYTTDRIFGEGIAEPLYIISQKFYRLLKENNLAGNIDVSPVVVITN